MGCQEAAWRKLPAWVKQRRGSGLSAQFGSAGPWSPHDIRAEPAGEGCCSFSPIRAERSGSLGRLHPGEPDSSVRVNIHLPSEERPPLSLPAAGMLLCGSGHFLFPSGLPLISCCLLQLGLGLFSDGYLDIQVLSGRHNLCLSRSIKAALAKGPLRIYKYPSAPPLPGRRAMYPINPSNQSCWWT